MENTIQNGQTCLEKRGMEERREEIARSDYNRERPYDDRHKDALSDGDAQGKGTGRGGHGHFLPNCNEPDGKINYSNFDTQNGGGKYDIEGRPEVGESGRKASMARSLYNNLNQYGPTSVNTQANRNEGQRFF